MPIAFQQHPGAWRVPLYWVELDNSMAGLGRPNLPALLTGTMLATGDADPRRSCPHRHASASRRALRHRLGS